LRDGGDTQFNSITFGELAAELSERAIGMMAMGHAMKIHLHLLLSYIAEDLHSHDATK
jgi:hypothetical protein